MHGNWLRTVSGVAAIWMATAGAIYGAPYYWRSDPANETYTDVNNWTALTVPGTTDDAYFTNRLTQTVKVTAPITNRYLGVYGGTITFDAPGSNHTLTRLDVGSLTDAPDFTNTMILNATTVTVTSGQSGINVKDVTKAGNFHLRVQQGARISNGAGGLYIGGFGNRVGDTNILTVDGAGSRVDFASITLGCNSLNVLNLTNGGAIGQYNGTHNLYLNGRTANKSLRHHSRAVIGGGSPQSVANVANLTINALGGLLADLEIQPEGVAKTNTSELVLLTNGRLSTKNACLNYPGGTITLDGGKLALIEGGNNGILWNYGTIQGAGEILLEKNGQLQNITLNWITNTVGVTNFGVMAPGSAGSAGTIVISNLTQSVTFPTFMEVRPGCRLQFDIGGTEPSQYDRILCTNLNVFLGSNATPYTVQGGAIIDVALMNGFVPTGSTTYDVLVAKDIRDTSLDSVTINYPVEPASITWGASIVTNAGTGFTNEILRISASRLSSGTLIYIW